MTGFPEKALIFYEGLEADNSKAYWNDHRAAYEECVKAPMQALLAALEPEFGSAKFFRPYRDVRFSKDKTPYKTAAAAAVEDRTRGSLYVQLSADGLFLAGGAWQLATDQARRLRAAIAEERSGAALVTVLCGLGTDGLEVGGERLKRVPKEFGEDPPRPDLLTLKSLTASVRHEPGDWLHDGDEVLARVQDAWRALGPLNTWLRQHVGPHQDVVQR